MKKQIKSTNSPWNKNELRVMKLVENSTSSDVQVRANVAKSKYAPPEVLDDLARDEAPVVRANVARNESTPISTLKMLAIDENAIVRTSI